MPVLISVVICTHNRAEILPIALQSVCDQTLAPSFYEVLVVDNNSTDGTAEIVREFAEKYAFVKYCHEPRVGLSHARNCGWRHARGEYIAYIDDDCKLTREWVAVAQRIIEKIAPAAFGGPVFPFYDGKKPEWFKDAYGTNQIDKEGILQTPLLTGNNMIIRKDILERLGGFDTTLGMNGKRIAYGEETRLFQRMLTELPGEVLYYHPDLYLYHLIRPEKMTLPWLVKGFFAKGRYSYLTLLRNPATEFGTGMLVLGSCKLILMILYDLSVAMLFRNQTEYPYSKNYIYEHTSHYLKSLGRLYAKHEVQSARKREFQS